MSHRQQTEYLTRISKLFPGRFEKRSVLEIGSMDVNGTVRGFFTECTYTGLDLAPGPGVDVVCGGQDFAAPTGSFDFVLSCEAMEHNPYWRETFANMIRLCRPGGMVLMTCATVGRAEHGTTRSEPHSSPGSQSVGWNYYKNLVAKDFSKAADLDQSFEIYEFFDNYEHCDLYFLGIKRGEGTSTLSAETIAAFASLRSTYRTLKYTPSKALVRMLLVKALGDTGFGHAKTVYRATKRISMRSPAP